MYNDLKKDSQEVYDKTKKEAYEIAEQKGIEVTLNARTNGYPLQVRLEPDEG